jgi:hypothetical protein
MSRHTDTESTDALPRTTAALADVAAARPFERKLLVCAKAAHGRELLRSLASRGIPWIGFDVLTPSRLAFELVAADLALEGLRVTDELDELALIDAAMDDVLGDRRGRLQGRQRVRRQQRARDLRHEGDRRAPAQQRELAQRLLRQGMIHSPSM